MVLWRCHVKAVVQLDLFLSLVRPKQLCRFILLADWYLFESKDNFDFDPVINPVEIIIVDLLHICIAVACEAPVHKLIIIMKTSVVCPAQAKCCHQRCHCEYRGNEEYKESEFEALIWLQDFTVELFE